MVGYSGKHRLSGVKRSLVGDARGHPLSLVLGKANVHDQTLALRTVDGIRIAGKIRRPKRLGTDKGFDSDPLRADLRRRHIIPVIIARDKHEPRLTARERREQKYCRKRWRIERTFAWINVNRRIDRLLIRKMKSYEMFMKLAFIRHYLKLIAP